MHTDPQPGSLTYEAARAVEQDPRADPDHTRATSPTSAPGGGNRCAEMRRRGDAILALCWALRQGADPVKTAQKIGEHAANIAVHYGLPAPSVATPPQEDGS